MSKKYVIKYTTKGTSSGPQVKYITKGRIERQFGMMGSTDYGASDDINRARHFDTNEEALAYFNNLEWLFNGGWADNPAQGEPCTIVELHKLVELVEHVTYTQGEGVNE